MKKTAIIQALQPSDLERIRHIAGWYLQEWHTPPERTLRRLSAQGGEDVYFQLIATVDGVLAGTGGLCRQVNILGVYPELAAYGP